MELLKIQQIGAAETSPHAYLVAVGERAAQLALPLAERMRDETPGLRLVVDAAAGSFKAKLKRADRSDARLALILGDAEAEAGTLGIKDLRSDEPQTTVAQKQIGNFLRNHVLN